MFIASYAPTLEVSEKKPAIRDEYYQELESIINTVSKRDILIVGGDQNAKLGTGHEEYPESIGHYGKGAINSNGKYLAEMCMRNGIVLTNTMFKHKMSHRTTWEGPSRINEQLDKNGEVRRNPYRNQIDFIMMRNTHRLFIQDSRQLAQNRCICQVVVNCNISS